jgi:hypothetical protein
MSLFRKAAMSPEQIERRNRTRAKGRKHFILYRGILGYGGFMFIFMTVFQLLSEFGWHFPHGVPLYFNILIGLIIWPVAGYFWAAWIWKTSFEKSSP